MTSGRQSPRNVVLGALVGLFTMALAPTTVQAKIYFSAFLAEGGTGIERAGLDGSGVETLQFEPAGFEDGLALDTPAGRMYWTDTNASVIASANMNGTDMQIVLDDFGEEPLGIALDVAAGKMYWTDREGVKRANLNGGEVELLTKEQARGFIALDLSDQQMYWADWPSGTIKTAAMGVEPTVTDVATKQVSPFGIAVDEAAGQVYWLQLNLDKKKTEKNVIRRANLDGSELETLIERPGAGFEGGLALDPDAGKMYWTEAEAHDVAVANLNGSEAETLLSTGEDSPEGLAIETLNPQPTNTAAPVIEGSPQVGSPLGCNPGTWTGTGPITFAYQWDVSGATAIEGATGSTYVPSVEQAGAMLACVVTASDDVQTTTATSAAVGVTAISTGGFTGASDLAPASAVETPLVAGIAVAQLTASTSRVRVPVFTSLPAAATLTATPTSPRRKPARAVSSGTRNKPKRLTVRKMLAAGRGTITLTKLVPGTTYRLVLKVTSDDGQSAVDAATLKIAKR